ncbi:tyrosine-type recombinase/integrase [Mycobacterium lentiflavum]|uniref:Site-specific integrase n=1 Tax=Mycobacterium lentiflavum TaxID=141349 RepID=A0ABY3V7H8_MYCLN|nr:site-specific integrase [Mycobacterium lentiflavum]ULP45554.1 site-specific integrase [Mycobacterium lentiflavum]
MSDSEQRVADGFPVVVDQDGFPVEEILGFFVARSYSARSTSAQYARVFARLCDFLEFRGARSLLDATQKDLSAYRVYRTQTAAQPISQYAFRVEATALRQFYSWAVESGRLRQSPVKKFSKVGRDNLSTNRIRHSKVRHVDGYLYDKWLEEAGCRSAGASVRSARERNIAAFKTLVSTGLRIQELASLLTLDIDNGQLLKHAMVVEMESITKYEINRNAIIPNYALTAIRKYRKLERPNVVLRHQRSLAGQLDGCFMVEYFDPGTRRVWGLWRGRRRQYLLHQVPVEMRLKAVIVSADRIVEPLCLFLSDSRGLGMTRSGWEGVFTATSEQLLRRYPADRQVRKVTPHDLRHTFAINYLRAAHQARAKAQGQSTFGDGPPLRDPLIDLQELLGHATSAQTLRYLRYVEDIDIAVAAAAPDSAVDANDDRAAAK